MLEILNAHRIPVSPDASGWTKHRNAAVSVNRLRLHGPTADTSDVEHSDADRRARVDAAFGRFAHTNGSSKEFLQRKQQEIDEEYAAFGR